MYKISLIILVIFSLPTAISQAPKEHVINHVDCSTAAFIGIAERGPIGTPIFINNWTEFTKAFGYFSPNSYLAYAVNSFFQEGGSSCYVMRVATDKMKTANITISDESNTDVIKVKAISPGTWGNRVTVTISDHEDDLFKFNMAIKYKEDFAAEFKETNQVVEEYQDLHLEILKGADGNKVIGEDGNIVYAAKWSEVNGKEGNSGGSNYVRLTLLNHSLRPANGDYILQNGDSADILEDVYFVKAFSAFDIIEKPMNFAIPDKAGDREVILAGMAYCKKRGDSFFVADAPLNIDPESVKHFKSGQNEYDGQPLSSGYGALYYPWVYIKDPITSEQKLIPPSGLVAGVYARTEIQSGIHKAPAGTDRGHLKTIANLDRIITQSEQDILSPAKINVIRPIPQIGFCVWGTKTLSADTQWKRVQARRLTTSIEVSIYQGTLWTVFERNTPSLQKQIEKSITNYLTQLWKNDMLVGKTAEEAFWIKVDAENNPQDVIDREELFIDIGIATFKPGVFNTFSIYHKTP